MKIGGQIPWNTIPICETSRSFLEEGHGGMLRVRASPADHSSASRTSDYTHGSQRCSRFPTKASSRDPSGVVQRHVRNETISR